MCIEALEYVLGERSSAVEDWFAEGFRRYPAVLNTSVDIRSSEYKIAPVDVNFFPAGYNNFGEHARKRAMDALFKYLQDYLGSKILIVVESHTRNKKYVDSVITLRDMLCGLGFSLEVGACGMAEDVNVLSSAGTVLNLRAVVKSPRGEVSTVSGFTPDLILLNSDLTSGVPNALNDVRAQRIVPPLCLGWFGRRKSRYFGIYNKIVEEFCEEFGLDAWGFCALFRHCDNVDFVNGKGVDYVADGVSDLIDQINQKFRFYGLDYTPYVFIKADNGTYGMGVIEVYSGEDVLNMNKKNRNKMRRIKGNNPVTSVVLQEGVSTSETFDNHVAEPLLYFVGDEPVCYLYRYSATRSKFENLNTPGCGFVDVEHTVDEKKKRVWRVVGKLAVLASAVEAQEMEMVNSHMVSSEPI
ncbi:MAG: glutamate--cysteine ligase [Anaplasma sp.]